MTDADRIERVDPRSVHAKVESGKALLVCAYEEEEKCRQMNLEGAISLKELEARLPSLPRDKEIIFYCA